MDGQKNYTSKDFTAIENSSVVRIEFFNGLYQRKIFYKYIL